MQIDHNERGNPHAMLVSVSPAPAPDPDGRYFTVFIPIDEILKLRHTDKTLAGHPWFDVPQDEIIGFSISKADHNAILRHLEKGRFIAIRAVGQRGRKSKGCYLDRQGQPLVQYRFSWRDAAKYIPDPIDRWWLEEFSRESARYAAVMPKPRPTKKKRLKAKERRRMAKSYD
jgi:hypothetical protein